MDIPGMTTRLPYTDYYMTNKRDTNSEQQAESEKINSKLHFIKPCIKE